MYKYLLFLHKKQIIKQTKYQLKADMYISSLYSKKIKKFNKINNNYKYLFKKLKQKLQN